MSDFYRIKRLPPYVFEQVNRLKAKARAGGADIIDMGMGNPDLPAPKHVIDKLVETAGIPAAKASCSFIRTPEPLRMGQTKTAASESGTARSGTKPSSVTAPSNVGSR